MNDPFMRMCQAIACGAVDLDFDGMGGLLDQPKGLKDEPLQLHHGREQPKPRAPGGHRRRRPRQRSDEADDGELEEDDDERDDGSTTSSGPDAVVGGMKPLGHGKLPKYVVLCGRTPGACAVAAAVARALLVGLGTARGGAGGVHG